MLKFSNKVQTTREGLYASLRNLGSNKTYNVNWYSQEPTSLPAAPTSPWRKAPVKLRYDRQEYHMFRLPSEEKFLLGPFDRQEIFGKKEGRTHSKQVAAHINLDNNLIFALAIFTVLALWTEYKDHDEYYALRENFKNNDMGKFAIEDFK